MVRLLLSMTLREGKGMATKEVTGKATGKRDLEVAGNNEQVAGKIQKKIGQIKVLLGK